jgi:hypothetical protein
LSEYGAGRTAGVSPACRRDGGGPRFSATIRCLAI